MLKDLLPLEIVGGSWKHVANTQFWDCWSTVLHSLILFTKFVRHLSNLTGPPRWRIICLKSHKENLKRVLGQICSMFQYRNQHSDSVHTNTKKEVFPSQWWVFKEMLVLITEGKQSTVLFEKGGGKMASLAAMQKNGLKWQRVMELRIKEWKEGRKSAWIYKAPLHSLQSNTWSPHFSRTRI